MDSEEALRIAAHQRQRFNQLVDKFDVPQPVDVVDRLRQIVAAAELQAGDVVLDVGTGVGVLVPLIESSCASVMFACDVSERMLACLHQKYPHVRVIQADISSVPLAAASVDAIFMNAMFGNIADKPAACRESARVLRPGGRLVVSHPEGREFVARLRATTDLFIEPLPTREEFEHLAAGLSFEVTAYRDEPKLYLLVARKNL
jgi:ubiquinone/menaquinone biosynthesis C-methylase UbiE